MIQDPWYLLRSSRMTLCFRRRVKECVCREDVYWIWIIYQTDFNWISCEQYILFCLLFFSNKWERWGIRTKGYLFRYYFTTWCVVDITYKPGNFSLIISSDIFIQWNQQKREWIIQIVMFIVFNHSFKKTILFTFRRILSQELHEKLRI